MNAEGITIRERAYNELKSLGCKFGYFPISKVSNKGRLYITKTKRNTLKARDVKEFPENKEQLKNWLTGKDKKPLKQILNSWRIRISHPDIQTEPYNTLVEINPKKVVVFDCDRKSGKDGYEVLKNIFIEAFKTISIESEIEPDNFFTCINKTPNGGYHIYFKLPKGKTPFNEFNFGQWGTEYEGLEIKRGLMFSGVAITPKYEKVDIPPSYHEPGGSFTEIHAQVEGEGLYQIKKWDGLIELPEEVYEYFEYLNKKHSNVKIRRKKIHFSGKLKNSSDKLYTKILNGIVLEGSRFLSLQSFAGYLTITSKTYAEAEAIFTEKAYKNTNPPFPEDSPAEWEALKEFLQNLWINTHGSLFAVNSKHTQKDAILDKEYRQELIQQLEANGIHFLKNVITDDYEIEIEDGEEKNILTIDKNISTQVKSILFTEIYDRIGKKLSFRDINILVYSGEKFAQKYDPINDFWDTMEEIENTDPTHEFTEALVSDEYDPKTREKILKYLLKWFIVLYWNSRKQEVEWDNPDTPRNNVMLILIGKQQIGKGSFVGKLFPPHLLQLINKIPKDAKEREFNKSLISKILIHWDDAVQTFDRKDWERIKHIITADSITWTPKYSNINKDKPQRASHIATTNDNFFLTDIENLRYFPVKVRKYPRNKYVPPKIFWGNIKYLAENIYKHWKKFTYEDQKFFNELSKKHIKATDIQNAIFANFEILKVKSKTEAKEYYYNKWNHLRYKCLAFLPLSYLEAFLNKDMGLKTQNGEVRNILHQLGYKAIKPRVDIPMTRTFGFFVIPLTLKAHYFLSSNELSIEA